MSDKRRLTEVERLEIINELEKKKKTSSKRYLRRTYNVTEGAIRKIWQNKEEIKKRCAEMSEERRNKKTQGCSSKISGARIYNL